MDQPHKFQNAPPHIHEYARTEMYTLRLAQFDNNAYFMIT